MARKRKYIDRKLLKELAMCQLTNDEIARCCRVDRNTIERRYGAAIKAWKDQGVGSMRRRLYNTAQLDEPIIIRKKEGDEIVGYKPASGAVPSMIFFLKNFGGMKDVVENQEPKRLDFGGLPVPNDEPTQAHKPN